MHLGNWAHHHVAQALIILFCIWLSLCLIIRLWLIHPKESVFKKVFWSFVLCIPFLGWIFYGAFHKPLETNSVINNGISIATGGATE